MSGIAGILGRAGSGNDAAMERMSAALAHRGPEGAGRWVSPADAEGRACFLTYRHLSVLDGGADVPQPVTRDGLAVVCDGSILNYRELGGGGSSGGGDGPAGDSARAAGGAHAEVIFGQVAAHGASGLAKLSGAFAFAWWDQSAGRLSLARDPLGRRPLYVARNPDAGGEWSLVFASEVRAILASGLLGKARLKPSAVADVVWNGFVMGPDTMIRGVESLLPGQVLTFAGDGRQERSEFFWSMPRPANGHTTRDERPMRQALRDVIRMNLTGDASATGIFLSGGIDSASVANLAQQQSDRPVKTFCLATEEHALNEADAARGIARAIGSEHHEATVTEGRFLDALDRALDSLDQPTFDALNQYHICQAIGEHGIRIALGGIGGDAIFGGDNTLSALPWLRRIATFSGWLPEAARVGAARVIASIAQRNGSTLGAQQRWAKLPSVTRAGSDLIALYQLRYALFLPEFQRELLGEAAAATDVQYGLPPRAQRWLAEECRDHSPIETAAILETRCFLGERLLRDADAVSAALGLELRSPLSDPRLIEEINRLPDGRKFLPVGYKPLLRRYGLEGLDPRLFDRPKAGFVLPIDRWIRQRLGDVMDPLMRDDRLAGSVGLRGEPLSRLWRAFRQGDPGLYWTRVWAIYVLIRWCQRYDVLI